MYNVNDMVVYGNQGVCEVVNIGTLSMSMVDKRKMYYTLRPFYHKDAAVYVPVDNVSAVMRPVISKNEAEKLIKKIPDIDYAWIVNEQERETQYKSALRTCDCEELIKIIKTLFKRKKSRIDAGKKVTVVDERYFKQAENQLYEELAFALGIDKGEVSDYINRTIAREKKAAK
ncbi:MAG: CarD family transcriptional regulator [Lachnospiraceae bacterium]|nr:CarD family transcriptional regulator [Lachnospiraceae bacterium]MBR6486315.1 CarD family transcriptional regulator [Lachnospiraceae bacterium]